MARRRMSTRATVLTNQGVPHPTHPPASLPAGTHSSTISLSAWPAATGRTSLGTHTSPFGGQITSYQGGAYGTATFGQFFVDATLWGDFGSGTVTRTLPHVGRTSTTSVKPDGFHADVEGGYRFLVDHGIGITPYIDIAYRDVDYGNISETGLGASASTCRTSRDRSSRRNSA